MLFLLDKETTSGKWNGTPLYEARSAIVKETLNGDFLLTVKYPITDSGIYQLFEEDQIIKAPVPVIGPQLFRLKQPVEMDNEMELTCYHITDDIMKQSVQPLSCVQVGCQAALNQVIQSLKTPINRFSLSSDIASRHTYQTKETKTLYSVLLEGAHSVVGTWEGELVRDNFSISMKQSRGVERHVVLSSHHNLQSFKRTRSSASVITRIHARSTFRPEGSDRERTLTVTVDSPLIHSYPYINEAEYTNNNCETVAALRKWANNKFRLEGVDKVNEQITIEAYKLEGQEVHIGDTVFLKSRKHSVDMKKKVVAYTFDALTETYISLTFDDKAKPGSTQSSGSSLSAVASQILGVGSSTQEMAIQRAIDNSNRAFEAAFGKQKEALEDGVEQAKAEAARYADGIQQQIAAQVSQMNQSMLENEATQANRYQTLFEQTKTSHQLATEARQLSQQVKQVTEQLQVDSKQQYQEAREGMLFLHAGLSQFQAVKETVDAYSRIIGTDGGTLSEIKQQTDHYKRSVASGGALSQVIQTSQDLVSRVGLLEQRLPNLVYDPTHYSKYRERMPQSGLSIVNRSDYKLLRISQSGLNTTAYKGFQMPLHSSQFTRAEKIAYRFTIWVDVLPDAPIGVDIKNGGTTILSIRIRPTRTGAAQIFTGTATVTTSTLRTDDYGLHVYLEKNGVVSFGQLMLVRGDRPIAAFYDDTSQQQVATETLVQQTAGSWAVKNLTSAGNLISSINLGANGTNRIDGRLTRITGQTLIDKAVIKSAMVDKLKTANFEAGSVTTTVLASNAVTAAKILVDQAFFNKLMANEAYLRQLFAKNAFITQVQAVTLSANKISGGILRATNNATTFNLTTGDLTFNTSSTITFNQSNNAIKRIRNGSTGFLHFNNSSAGGVFVGLGVTSHNEGVKSQDTARFAGVRVFRDNDSSDQLELYGDKVMIGHAFGSQAMAVWFYPTKLKRNLDLIDFLRWCRTEILRLHDHKTTEKSYNYTRWGEF